MKPAVLAIGVLATCSACTSGAARPAEDSSPAEPASTSSPALVVPTASPAKSDAPDVSASAIEPPVSGSPLGAHAVQAHSDDLTWLTELVRVLADEPASRAQLAAHLGRDPKPDPSRADAQLVQPFSPYISRISVYPLAHIRIDLATDIDFAPGERPSRAEVQRALGPLTAMPRAPGGVRGGAKLSFYREGKQGRVRVFVELSPEQADEVARLHIDLDDAVR